MLILRLAQGWCQSYYQKIGSSSDPELTLKPVICEGAGEARPVSLFLHSTAGESKHPLAAPYPCHPRHRHGHAAGRAAAEHGACVAQHHDRLRDRGVAAADEGGEEFLGQQAFDTIEKWALAFSSSADEEKPPRGRFLQAVPSAVPLSPGVIVKLWHLIETLRDCRRRVPIQLLNDMVQLARIQRVDELA